ncbi:MAG: LLM class flavin-dependent oxidoreductase [Gammaproteobacteria bacterium]
MAAGLTLSVTDQSPVHDGATASQGPLDTLKLAQACDRLGYHRYWIAEHHNTSAYASPCPEILVGHVAQITSNLRVGTGGVMLTHYSPLKVAETFRMLSVLHPGRIDLGVGRAPGGDPLATAALSYPRQQVDPQAYPYQVYQIMGHLFDNLPEDNPFKALETAPSAPENPEIWMLGSSDGSAAMCGQLGAAFALGLFIGTHERPAAIIDQYRDAFVPSAALPQPRHLVAAAVTCAATREDALRIAGTRAMWIFKALYLGQLIPLPSPDEVERYYDQFNDTEKAGFQQQLDNAVIGTPDDCRDQLHALAETYDCNEISVVSVTYHFKDRLRSYELLAEAFGLTG